MGNRQSVKQRPPTGASPGARGCPHSKDREREELGKAEGQTSPTQATQRAILSPFLLIHPPEILRASSVPGGDKGTDTLPMALIF